MSVAILLDILTNDYKYCVFSEYSEDSDSISYNFPTIFIARIPDSILGNDRPMEYEHITVGTLVNLETWLLNAVVLSDARYAIFMKKTLVNIMSAFVLHCDYGEFILKSLDLDSHNIDDYLNLMIKLSTKKNQ